MDVSAQIVHEVHVKLDEELTDEAPDLATESLLAIAQDFTEFAGLIVSQLFCPYYLQLPG
jgi:monomeric isocitrate dehydrogenase